MGLNIVTGIGPRVGSSFVMQQCKHHGLKIHGDPFLKGILPEEGNPEGYYDLLPEDVKNLKSGVAKVWPTALGFIPVKVNKLVVLSRKDLKQQKISIKKQMDREPFDFLISPSQMIELSAKFLTGWLESQDNLIVRSYYTEDLDNDIDDIVEFLGD